MFNIFADGQIIYQPGNDALSLISPKLTVEMGKAGSLEFSLPPNNRFYNNLDQIRTKLTVMMDGDEIFRGRVLSNKRSFNNVREVYGEGDLSYLVDSCQQGKKFEGKAHTLFRKIIAEHNRMIQNPEKQFTVGNITVDDYDVILKGQSDDIDVYESTKFKYKQIALNSIAKEWLNTYDYIETALLDYCGGYLRTRYDAATGKTYIDWLKDYYEVSTQTIQFGKNLLDLTEEISAEDLFTVLIPLGDENLTIKDVNNGSVELVDEAAVAKYGRIIKTNVFDGVTKASTLLTNGKRYLKNHVEVPVTYEIKAVDLHLVNPGTRAIFVGDKVHVLSPAHEIDNSDLVCTKIEYDLTNPANTTYTFGNPKQDLTERYRKNRKDDSGRGGGGGAAAAEEVSKDNLEIYKSWVKYDPDKAEVDIGALYQLLNPDKTIALNSTPQILMGADKNGNKINLQSVYEQETENMLHNYAGIDIKTGKQGPYIDLYINDKNQGMKASITMNIDEIGTYTDEEGHVHSRYGSKIALDSDMLKIDNKVTELTTEVATIKTDYFHLDTDILDIVSNNLKISGNSGEITLGSGRINVTGGLYGTFLYRNKVEIACHTHAIRAEGGKIYIGTADTWDDGAENSFNIADTAFYKNTVSALTIKTVGVTFNRDKTNVVVKVTSKSNDTLWSADNATYTNKYQPTSIGIKVVANGDHYTLTPRPFGPGSSGLIYKPDGSDWDEISTGDAIYKSVTIKNSGWSIETIKHEGEVIGVTVHATASNGNKGSHYFSF